MVIHINYYKLSIMLNYVEMYYGHTDIRKNATIGIAYMTQDRLTTRQSAVSASDTIANFATRVS